MCFVIKYLLLLLASVDLQRSWICSSGVDFMWSSSACFDCANFSIVTASVAVPVVTVDCASYSLVTDSVAVPVVTVQATR